MHENMRKQIPVEVQAVMESAMRDLMNSDIVGRALKVGDAVPDFSLPDTKGALVKLSDLLQSGPVVLAFYRGGWCPYCNIELRGLQKHLAEMQKLGVTLVAVSPQLPDQSLSTEEKDALTFPVLSDVGNKVASQFGLVFSLPPPLREIYEKFGINLPKSNGDSSFELPLAATYIIKRDRTVAWSFVDVDYTKRADPQDVIGVLKSL